MGLSTQAFLLQLTHRKADIQLMSMTLANEKMSLSREMQNLSRNYQNSLNKKSLVWSNNSGASYVDLSYNNLMKPGVMNQNTPYLLTDYNGRIVLDKSYQRYAEMISANGAPGGDWESNRNAILASLIGIDPSLLDASAGLSEEAQKNKAILDALIASEPKKESYGFAREGIYSLLEKAGTSTGISEKFKKGDSWQDCYTDPESSIKIGKGGSAVSNFKAVMEHLANSLKQYFPDNAEGFEKAVKEMQDEYEGFINNGTDLNNSAGALRGDSKDYEINVKSLIDEFVGKLINNGAEVNNNTYNGQAELLWADINDSSYKQWLDDYANWESDYKDALATYNSSVNADNMLLTAEQEGLIKYYDTLFSAIAEKGWIYNDNISDNEYLNQMLQNNLYTLTTVNRTSTYNEDEGEYIDSNEYSTDIATNCTNIFSVSNTEARETAQAEYEFKKGQINAKETRIDTRMSSLQTELSAINKMMESSSKIIGDNIDRTFKIFS